VIDIAQPGRRCLLFTGHRVDVLGRQNPRFPAAAEALARKMIAEAVEFERSRYPGLDLCGIASGANGGDILFLEVCTEAGIPTEMYLAMNAEQFIEASVADGGHQWVERFHKLVSELPVHILQEDANSELNVWQRTNLWMLDTALSISGHSTTVIALWDGGAADGAGGTKHMARRARNSGAHFVLLDASLLTDTA